jgi:cytochrome c-type biogenesis protein CcmH/NrfF
MKRDGYKSWPVWAALGVIVIAALAVGVARTGGARTPQQRIDAIARTLKCPPCEGESVYESRNSVALNIKNEIAREIRAGQTDDEIRAGVAERFGDEVLLVPSATGVDSLVWILPVVVFVAAAAGLGVAFVRWRTEVAGAGEPSVADRALVADALDEEAWP